MEEHAVGVGQDRVKATRPDLGDGGCLAGSEPADHRDRRRRRVARRPQHVDGCVHGPGGVKRVASGDVDRQAGRPTDPIKAVMEDVEQGPDAAIVDPDLPDDSVLGQRPDHAAVGVLDLPLEPAVGEGAEPVPVLHRDRLVSIATEDHDGRALTPSGGSEPREHLRAGVERRDRHHRKSSPVSEPADLGTELGSTSVDLREHIGTDRVHGARDLRRAQAGLGTAADEHLVVGLDVRVHLHLVHLAELEPTFTRPGDVRDEPLSHEVAKPGLDFALASRIVSPLGR